MRRKNSDLENPGQIIIPAGHPNPPEQHEIDTAEILIMQTCNVYHVDNRIGGTVKTVPYKTISLSKYM